MHPAWLRCSSFIDLDITRSSRLASGAPFIRRGPKMRTYSFADPKGLAMTPRSKTGGSRRMNIAPDPGPTVVRRPLIFPTSDRRASLVPSSPRRCY